MTAFARLTAGNMPRVVATTALVVFSLAWSSGIAEAVASGDYLDEFSAVAYSGSNGTIDWTPAPWSELGELDGPTAGLVQVVTDTQCDGGAGNCLRIGEDGDGVIITGFGAVRDADLAGAGAAVFSYSYRRLLLDSAGGSIAVEVSGNGGGSWTTLASYSLSTSDPSNVGETFDISAYIAAKHADQVNGKRNRRVLHLFRQPQDRGRGQRCSGPRPGW